MKRFMVEPRTAEWHAIRRESWTASIAATLVAADNAKLLRNYAATQGVTLDIEPLLAIGMDTFYENTLWSVYADKFGMIPRFGGNAHTVRGTENEELVIQFFEKKERMAVEREVTAQSSEYPGIMASFDALAPESSDLTEIAPYGFPVEAKCPEFPSRKKMSDAHKEGKPYCMGLPYYWCQVQHQIWTAEAPYGWFVAAGVEVDEDTGEKKLVFPIIEKVMRDDKFLAAYIPAAKFYHEHFIDAYVEPPKLPLDEDRILTFAKAAAVDRALAGENHAEAVDLYLAAAKEAELAKERMSIMENKLLELATKLRAEGVNVVTLDSRIQVTYASGETFSWKKAAEELSKRAGNREMPKDIKDMFTTIKESVKLKEVV